MTIGSRICPIRLPRWDLIIEETSRGAGIMNVRLDNVQEGILTRGGRTVSLSRLHLDADLEGNRARIQGLLAGCGHCARRRPG